MLEAWYKERAPETSVALPRSNKCDDLFVQHRHLSVMKVQLEPRGVGILDIYGGTKLSPTDNY